VRFLVDECTDDELLSWLVSPPPERGPIFGKEIHPVARQQGRSSVPAHRLSVGLIYVGQVDSAAPEGSLDGLQSIHTLQVGQVLGQEGVNNSVIWTLNRSPAY
jgi:hypothetical protein